MLKRYFIPLLVGLLFVVVAIYFLSGSAHKPTDVKTAVPVEHFTLRNGLSVVVIPSDRVPVVSHLLIVKAGAADDPYGKSGLAHYLEHLLFTGTSNFPEGAYEKSVARVGGNQNAMTSDDFTLYYATVPPEHLDMVMTMEADRFANLEFAPQKATRELGVITEERALRVENSPVSQWIEQLDGITFLNHPYGHPTIGWAEDMATLTAEDARAFFAQHYRPSNMMLVVAGDVRPREVRRMAQRYYGGLVAGPAEPRNWPKEPPIRLQREATMRDARVNEPRVMIQFVAPSVREGDTSRAMPLSVFAQYLGGGDASLLYTSLVREQKLATSISAEYNPHAIGPALFRIIAVPAAGVKPTELAQAMERALKQALATTPEHAAIERAKTLLSAEVIFAQDGMQSLAQVMAGLYAIGLDENYFYGWQEAIRGVTETSALEAARTVLVPARSVTGYLLPEEAPAPAAPVAEAPKHDAPAKPTLTPMQVPYGP